MTVIEDTTQDMSRNHERDDVDTQRRVTWLCRDHGFGHSKATRLVRRFIRDSGRWAETGGGDALFIDFLISEAVVAKHRAKDELTRLQHADPTAQTAIRNADAADAGVRVKATWGSEYDEWQYQRAASVAGLARHQIVRGDAA